MEPEKLGEEVTTFSGFSIRILRSVLHPTYPTHGVYLLEESF